MHVRVAVFVEDRWYGVSSTFEIGCVGFQGWGARYVVCYEDEIGTPRREKE